MDHAVPDGTNKTRPGTSPSGTPAPAVAGPLAAPDHDQGSRPHRTRSPFFDLVTYIERQIDFSTRAFGPGDRLNGVLAHMAKEIEEVRATPRDPYEWADLIILALDGAWRQGISPDDIAWALLAKQATNSRRAWPDWRTASPDQPIEHDRSGEGSPDQPV